MILDDLFLQLLQRYFTYYVCISYKYYSIPHTCKLDMRICVYFYRKFWGIVSEVFLRLRLYTLQAFGKYRIGGKLKCIMCAVLCCVQSRQSRPALCGPMDCSPPGSSVRGILQARILEWVAVLSSRGYSRPRSLLCCKWILYLLGHQRSPKWIMEKIISIY